MKTKQVELIVLIVAIAMVAFSAVMVFVVDDPEWSSRTNFILAVAFAVYIGYVTMTEKSAEKLIQKRDEQIAELNQTLHQTREELSQAQNKAHLLANQLQESQSQVSLLESEKERLESEHLEKITALKSEISKLKEKAE